MLLSCTWQRCSLDSEGISENNQGLITCSVSAGHTLSTSYRWVYLPSSLLHEEQMLKFPHSPDEETRAKRGWMAYWRPHSLHSAELEFTVWLQALCYLGRCTWRSKNLKKTWWISSSVSGLTCAWDLFCGLQTCLLGPLQMSPDYLSSRYSSGIISLLLPLSCFCPRRVRCLLTTLSHTSCIFLPFHLPDYFEMSCSPACHSL